MRRYARIEEKGLATSPTAVGTPGEDRSGQIIAGGVQTFAKAMIERDDKINSLAATAKFGDFNAAYTRGKADLQQKYRDNPREYPKAARELSAQLTNQFGATMPSGVQRKFRDITTNNIAQDSDNIVSWSIQQEQENIVGDITKSYQDVALAAEAAITPEDLRKNLKDLEEVHVKAGDFISPASNIGLKASIKKLAINNSLSAGMLTDPSKVNGDLIRGKYDDMLTPVEVKTFINSSLDAMLNHALRAQYESLKTTSVAMSVATDAVLDGTLQIGEINRVIDIYELNKNKKDINGQPVISPEAIDGYKRLREMALKQNAPPPAERSIKAGAFMADFTRQWDKFLAEGGSKRTVASATEEVKLYAKLLEARDTGVINDKEFNTKKAILDTKIRTRSGKKNHGLSLTEAFATAGKSQWFHSDDIYTHGYNMIRKEVEAQKDVPREEKQRLMDQYFLTFTKELGKLPAEIVDNIENSEKAASDILKGTTGKTGLLNQMVVYKDPEFGPLYYGQTVVANGQTKVFLGRNPATGKGRWGTSKKVMEGFENK